MTTAKELFDRDVYGVPRQEKRALLTRMLNDLTRKHAQECIAYGNILKAYGIEPGSAGELEDVPFIPVRLFKEVTLKSVPDAKVVKTLTSSGTTAQNVSKVFLDSVTAWNQTNALVKIMTSFIGKGRLPMLIIDHPSVVKDRRNFPARGAGILGMSTFGRDHCYVLRDGTMELDIEAVRGFIERHAGETILLFGFTFMVWLHLVRHLEISGLVLPLDRAILFHSGGWKRLQDEAVDGEVFRQRLHAVTGITRVYNFYGMVEQVGSIFVECEHGRLHAPIFADVVVRSPRNWRPANVGENGVLQVLSVLPESYPGHSLLTEDQGVVLGEDDCPCSRLGKYFRIIGRVAQAEIRGCSDTYAADLAVAG